MDIAIHDAIWEYPDKTSVGPIDLTVEDGEFVVLTGPSGCGKTTVTRMINGIIPHLLEGRLEGEVQLNGADTISMKTYDITSTVASVFQNPKTQFFTTNTTAEILFPAENLGMGINEMKARLDAVVNRFGIGHLMDRSIFVLSGGQKQLICLAACCITDVPCVVLDEPTSNLDIDTIERIGAILAELKQAGKTIVVSEHRLDWLSSLADRVIVMRDGQVERAFVGDEFKSLSSVQLHDMGLRGADPPVPRISARSEDERGGLVIEELDCGYGKKPLLHIRDLMFLRGKVTAVVGGNGQGKTTLGKALCGLVKPIRLKVTMDGLPVRRRWQRDSCYMILQDVNAQLFTSSVEKEILLSNGACDPQEYLAVVGLENKHEEHPLSLSGGERQRLAIAAALAAKRDVLVADEPTSGMDYLNMRRVAAAMRRYADAGRIVVLITHDRELIEACADEIVVVEDGEVHQT